MTCTIRLEASLGGRMTAPWYLTATMLARAAGGAPARPSPAAVLAGRRLVRLCSRMHGCYTPPHVLREGAGVRPAGIAVRRARLRLAASPPALRTRHT